MRVRHTVLAVFFALACLVAAVGGWLVAKALGNDGGSPGSNLVLKNLTLPLFDGGPHETDGPGMRRGEVVVLDFWASWCSPCHVQSRILGDLAKDYSGSVRFFAVNVGESREVVRSSLQEHPISFPVLLDKNGESASGAGVVGMPTLVVLDRNGSIVLRRTGLTSARFLRSALDEVLARPSGTMDSKVRSARPQVGT